MNIQHLPRNSNLPQRPKAPLGLTKPGPSDLFSPGIQAGGSPKAGYIALGLTTGAIGVGAPAALGMAAVKAFASGQIGLTAGLALGAAGLAATLTPVTVMGAVMSTAGGDSSGWKSYLAGAGLGIGAAALAVF